MKKQIENNRWARGDMEFLSECSTRYFMSERSKREEGDFIHVSKRERVGIHPQRYIHCVTCKQVIGDLKHVKISLFFFFFFFFPTCADQVFPTGGNPCKALQLI